MTDLQGQGQGISRRAMFNRSAAALGIALAGNLEGLFGDAITQASAHGRQVGYGPLITDPNGRCRCPRASGTPSSRSRA